MAAPRPHRDPGVALAPGAAGGQNPPMGNPELDPPRRRFLLEGALDRAQGRAIGGPADGAVDPNSTGAPDRPDPHGERPIPPTLELIPSDREHLLKVLRLGAGELILGLDGRGGTWPLRIAAADKRRLVLEPAGDPSFEPRPGDPGAPLPWIEVASALPKAGRAEDLLDRLTQIGVAAWTPLTFERSSPAARGAGSGRERRLLRAVGEACKQSRRGWIPQICGAAQLVDWIGDSAGPCLGVLTPGERRTPAVWLDELGAGPFPPERPIRLLVGPEGGLTPRESELLGAAGAVPIGLGPHIHRIETAAEAGLAGLVQAWWARNEPGLKTPGPPSGR